ncbi:MAG: sodium ion-translocating decarboxylase subunit beta, partial [Chloroflexota bacterium]
MDINSLLELFQAPAALTWKDLVMMAVGLILIYLAIAKDYEPVLLLPIGFSAILTNLPMTGIADSANHGFLAILFDSG